MNDLITLATPAQYQETIKRSLFSVRAARVSSVAIATEFFDRRADRTATHNCWAYRIDSDFRFNDDGEPSGSAGQPILRAIDGQGLNQVAVLVIRHYGGIKLGVGGLMRAYGGCAAKCLRAAEKKSVAAMAETQVDIDFGDVGAVYALLDRFDAVRLAADYLPQGVRLTIRFRVNDGDALTNRLRDATQGRVQMGLASG